MDFIFTILVPLGVFVILVGIARDMFSDIRRLLRESFKDWRAWDNTVGYRMVLIIVGTWFFVFLLVGHGIIQKNPPGVWDEATQGPELDENGQIVPPYAWGYVHIDSKKMTKEEIREVVRRAKADMEPSDSPGYVLTFVALLGTILVLGIAVVLRACGLPYLIIAALYLACTVAWCIKQMQPWNGLEMF